MTIATSDDYASLTISDDLSFYYGYEVTVDDNEDLEEDPEWCFQVRIGLSVITIPTSDLINLDERVGWLTPAEMLLRGIGRVMTMKLLGDECDEKTSLSAGRGCTPGASKTNSTDRGKPKQHNH